jgi:DNA-binding transcriptional regulator LsrR (DeoR family)
LTEARARGIVEILVHYPWRTSPELEKQMLSTFNLKAVRVMVRGNKSYQDMLIGLGVLAAQYFTSILRLDDVVGISWGTGLYQMVRALRPMSCPNVEVVQLVGGTGTEKSSAVGPLLAPILANSLGCPCYYLHAPLITETETGRDAILQERTIRETLEHGEKANIALVGIGSTTPEIYNPYRLGYVSESELLEVRQAGAIGLVCGQHFTINGEILDISINRRVVALSLQKLAKVEKVIGVAGDERKGEAILGALRGGFINILITDDSAAQKVLSLHAINH